MLKHTLNHGLVLQKVHWVIEFNQETWLKQYLDLNMELRTKTKKDFFKWMIKPVFEKNM